MLNKKGFLKDKKGGEKLLSAWWFFILIIIGAGIVLGVVVFYSVDVNIKEIEASILADRIADCIVQQGFLEKQFLQDKQNFDFFKNCQIDKNVIGGSQNYYFDVSIYDFGSCSNDITKCTSKIENFSFSTGVKTFAENCDILAKGVKAGHFPGCARKVLFVFNKYDKSIPEKLVVDVLASSNQEGKRKGIVNDN